MVVFRALPMFAPPVIFLFPVRGGRIWIQMWPVLSLRHIMGPQIAAEPRNLRQ